MGNPTQVEWLWTIGCYEAHCKASDFQQPYFILAPNTNTNHSTIGGTVLPIINPASIFS